MFVTLQLEVWPEIKDSQRSKTRAPQEQSNNQNFALERLKWLKELQNSLEGFSV